MLDVDNQKFGFTGDQYAIEYELNNVDGITIQNVLPAKGGGYVELSVQPKLGYSESIYYGELNSLDEYAVCLKSLRPYRSHNGGVRLHLLVFS